MLQGQSRDLVKRLVVLSRIKLLYDRITLTRHTTLYFFFSLFSCLLLCALQGVILSDNTTAVHMLTSVVDGAQIPPHIAVVTGDELRVCDSIPGRRNTNCTVLSLRTRQDTFLARRRMQSRQDPGEESDDESVESDDGFESEDSDDGDESDSDDEEDSDLDDLEDEEAESSPPAESPPIPGSTPSASDSIPVATVTSTISSASSISSVLTSIVSPTSTVGLPPASTTGPESPATASGTPIPQSGGIVLNQSATSPHSVTCIYSLSWLEEVLHDSQREDVATFFFQLWIFGIGLVAILNESLPHLGAAFFAHILSAAWASSRIQSTRNLGNFYRTTIVHGPCKGVDVLGSFWSLRLAHTIPSVVINVVSLVFLGYLSWKLFAAYAHRSFARFGASLSLNRIYKLVLFFSVGLQLASFFTAASTGLWIAKVAHGNWVKFANHRTQHMVAFVVTLVALLPWLVLGWVCVRKECKKRFMGFLFLSAVLISIPSAMFSSTMYRTIFMSWSFFATVTVTSFVLLVITTAFGIACFLNRGKGLAQYLEVSETLDGEDFAPIYLPRDGDKEKGGERAQDASFYYTDEKYDLERPQPNEGAQYLFTNGSGGATTRGASVYSDNFNSPVLISATPPFLANNAAPSLLSPALSTNGRFLHVVNRYSAELNVPMTPGFEDNTSVAAPPSTLTPTGRGRAPSFKTVSTFRATSRPPSLPASPRPASTSSSFSSRSLSRMTVSAYHPAPGQSVRNTAAITRDSFGSFNSDGPARPARSITNPFGGGLPSSPKASIRSSLGNGVTVPNGRRSAAIQEAPRYIERF